MKDKTFIVTGGNTGIGKAIALALAMEKAKVIIISRNPQKGEETLNKICTKTQNKRVELVVGDLGTVDGCHRLSAQLLEKYPDIHVLINNAGILMGKCEINAEGLKKSFMVNHMAPFILSNLLLDRLKKNSPARIVNVNAGLYVHGKVDLEKTPYGKDFGKFIGTYANTKLCNMLFTLELARRIEETGVTVNAVHP